MKSRGARRRFARLPSTCVLWLLPLAFLLDGCGLYLVLVALDIIGTDDPATPTTVVGSWLGAWVCVAAARLVLVAALDAWHQKPSPPSHG